MTASLLSKLPTGWPYVASIVLTKGFSLISIPLIAKYIAPEEFGRLDVAVSFIEFLGLIFALGLADTLFRFTSKTTNEDEQRKTAAEIAGTGLALAIILGLVVQLGVTAFLSTMPIPLGENAIRAGFFSASLAGLIALPLAWVRMKNRPLMFLAYTGTRGVLQASTTIWAAASGYGVEAILYTNAAVDILIATVILTLQFRETGIRFTIPALKRTISYGMPLVGGGLSMFALGACDRWFLVHVVPTHELAHYAIATKLALAAPLLMQPFGLWWYARRLAVLEGENGLQKSASIIGTGFTILLISAASISLAAPLFIIWLLPDSYAGAITYLPWIVAVTVLNEACSLMNVGVYRKNHGFLVLGVNATAAAIALIGYWLATPHYGIAGAIGVTLLAQTARLALFVIIGRSSAPIPYPYKRAALLTSIVILALWLAPDVINALTRVSWAFAAIITLSMASIACGMIDIRHPLLKKWGLQP